MAKDFSGTASAPSIAFTPGPWVIERNEGAYVKDKSMATLRIEERHSVHEYAVALIITDIPDLELAAEANARLIAAAPEMFEALTKAEALIRNGGTVPIKGETWKAICAALAKVTAP